MKILLCVTPGETYVDEDMETWEPIQDWDEEAWCDICEEKNGTDGFINHKDDSHVHRRCVKEVLPCEMFASYKDHSTMPEIMQRFITVFQAAEREFTKHMLEKGDSWLQLPIDNLFSLVHRTSAKLLLADKIDTSYDECIDLCLCAIMLAQRYLVDAQRDEEDIPF